MCWKWVFVRRCPYTCVLMGIGGQKSTLGVEPYFMHPPYFWRQGLLVAWNLPIKLDWVASEPQGSTRLHLPSIGNASTYCCAWLFFFFNNFI